jgi:nucleoside-specific outer membrane channel protein Tsx
MSSAADPGVGTNAGAQEVYIVYRNMLDIGKITGTPIKFGPVRGLGVTTGFDLNSKNDFYASKKQMLVAGPTLMFDVPGFVNLTALVLDESNASETALCHCRYHYKTHGALELDWGLPVPVPYVPLSFNGYALYIGSKGLDETGSQTVSETHIDMNLMADVGAMAGGAKGTFKAGFEYEYWRNKFGNSFKGPAGGGALAKTPMIRVEYHF